MTQNTSTTRGTDEAFLKLMEVSGTSVLKLFGFSTEQTDKYHFRAVVFKDKRVEPDVEGVPILESEDKRVFIEFQGYTDKFIRYRLISEVLLGCQSDQYEGQVLAGIVYTEKRFQQAALPIQAFEGTDCQLKGCVKEIVLTDYTEDQLRSIDPKLVVLAPFTLSSKIPKTTLLEKSKEWCETVTQVFTSTQQQEVFNLLGLFILNRFRNMSSKEVIAMLHFDLMDTVAGRQLYEEAHQKGLLEEARDMVIDNLEERFGMIPTNMIENIRGFTHRNLLKNLHKQAIRCADLEGFDKILLKNRIIIALEERFDGVSGQLLDQIRAINRQEVLDNLLQQARQCPDIDSFKKILSQTN